MYFPIRLWLPRQIRHWKMLWAWLLRNWRSYIPKPDLMKKRRKERMDCMRIKSRIISIVCLPFFLCALCRMWSSSICWKQTGRKRIIYSTAWRMRWWLSMNCRPIIRFCGIKCIIWLNIMPAFFRFVLFWCPRLYLRSVNWELLWRKEPDLWICCLRQNLICRIQILPGEWSSGLSCSRKRSIWTI